MTAATGATTAAAARLAGERAVLRLSGPDTRSFLQGLVTNDVRRLADGPVYAALLTPQGKYLFDFFLVADGEEAVLVDVAADRAGALAQRLGLYRLRAKVAIEAADLVVVVGTGPVPPGAAADPRHEGLGWRAVVADPAPLVAGRAALDPAAQDALRVALAVPESGADLRPDDSYILEMGFERLHGVDFRKGCYVGQEVTARMKHKAELRKGLARVRLGGAAPPPGTEITRDGRAVGTLLSAAGDHALAYLRFDRTEGAPAGSLVAGGVAVLPEA